MAEPPRPCLLDAWAAHERELRAWLHGRMHEAQDAEDLLQDLFLKALRQGRRFCEVSNARAWLFEATRNALADRLRLKKEQVELPDELAAVHEDVPAVESLSACLPRALAELPQEDREAITLCDLEGMTQEAYAHRKGISLPGAKSRVQRARKRLRERLTAACQIKFDDTGKVCCFSPRGC